MGMIFRISILLLVIFPSGLVGQNWQWVKSTGLGADPFGLTKTGTALYTCGAIIVNSTSCYPYLAKHDLNGNMVWNQTGSGTGFNNLHLNLESDAWENVYNVGVFTSSMILFGGDTLKNTSSNGNSDGFIVKYDSSGNVIWAKKIGDNGNDAITDIAIDKMNNIYVVGYFHSSSLIVGVDTLNSAGSGDMFLAKFDGMGNEIWAMEMGGPYDDEGLAITYDPSNNLYITGYFGSHSIQFGGISLINSGNYNMFLAKYSSSGQALWARKAGGIYHDEGYALTSDEGHVYLTGYFASPKVIFGNDTLHNSGNMDAFLTKYDSAGNVIWAKSGKGLGDDCGYCIAVDKYGIYWTGKYSQSYSSQVIFDNDLPPEFQTGIN